MVLEKLGEGLRSTLKKIANSIFVDERLVNELVKEIQKALLSADVNVKLVFELTNKIKERALKEDTPKTLDKKEHLINIVYEELVKFLGEEKAEIIIEGKKPYTIMMVGLFGSGKTTTTGKLAKYYSTRGQKVATMALDVHRPAAIDQLEQVSKNLGIKCFSNRDEKNPIKIYKTFEKELKDYDLLIIDTAGRDALSSDLIKEIEDINKTAQPNQRLLIINADIGQAAQAQAEAFHTAVDITGVIITKLDGTAKGGGALTACAVSGAKIRFIGTGEKAEDLEIFNPKGFVGRLLGMGDLEALLEKAKEAISEEDAEDLGKKFLKGDYNFLDLYEQLQAMKKMGPLSKVLDMIPGMGNANIPKDMLEIQQGKLEKWKYLMQSMTKEELEDPELLTASRIERIAKGSGSPTSEVRELIKQYRQSKKMMKMMKGKNPEKLFKKLGNTKGMKF